MDYSRMEAELMHTPITISVKSLNSSKDFSMLLQYNNIILENDKTINQHSIIYYEYNNNNNNYNTYNNNTYNNNAYHTIISNDFML